MGTSDLPAILTGVAAVLTAAGAAGKGVAELLKTLRKEKGRPDDTEPEPHGGKPIDDKGDQGKDEEAA